MTTVSYRAFRAWQRNFDVFRKTWVSQVAFTVVEPLITLTALGLGLGGYVALGSEGSYKEFLALGLLAAYAMFSSASECAWGTYFRLEYQRTFDAMIVTPLTIEDVIAGEILWGATRTIETTLALLLVIALFGVPLAPTAVFLLPAMLIQGIVFAAAGVIVVSLIPSIGQLNHFFTLFLIPQYMFAGVFFPLTNFPAWVEAVSWFMPLRHGVEVARGVVSGQVDVALLGHVAWLAVMAVVLTAVALRLMRRRLIH